MARKQVSPEHPLTQKQKAFIEEFLIDFNATRAVVAAGYKGDHAKQAGYEQLYMANVQAELKKRTLERSQRAAKTKDDVIRELENIAFARLSDYATWNTVETETHDPETDVTTVKDKLTFQVKDSNQIPDHAHAAIQEVSEMYLSAYSFVRRVKLFDKSKALALLAKHHGLLVDVVEHREPVDPRLSAALKATPEQRLARLEQLRKVKKSE